MYILAQVPFGLSLMHVGIRGSHHQLYGSHHQLHGSTSFSSQTMIPTGNSNGPGSRQSNYSLSKSNCNPLGALPNPTHLLIVPSVWGFPFSLAAYLLALLARGIVLPAWLLTCLPPTMAFSSIPIVITSASKTTNLLIVENGLGSKAANGGEVGPLTLFL